MQRGNACSWMAWTPPVRPLRSDTKAPANSTANTAASSANPPCGTFGPSAPQALCPSSRSATGQPPSNPVANKHAVAFCGLKILRFHAERLDFLLSVCVQSALPVLHTRHFDKAVRPSLIVLDHREIHSIFDAKLLEVGRIGRLDLFPFAALLISVTFKAVGGRGPRRCLVCLLRVHNLAVQDDLSPVGRNCQVGSRGLSFAACKGFVKGEGGGDLALRRNGENIQVHNHAAAALAGTEGAERGRRGAGEEKAPAVRQSFHIEVFFVDNELRRCDRASITPRKIGAANQGAVRQLFPKILGRLYLRGDASRSVHITSGWVHEGKCRLQAGVLHGLHGEEPRCVPLAIEVHLLGLEIARRDREGTRQGEAEMIEGGGLAPLARG